MMFASGVRRGMLAASVFLLSIATGHAQSASLTGPSLGFLWNDSDSSMRPLHGIVGNATVGDPVDLGITLSDAIALDGLHFLASAADNPTLQLINMEALPPSITAIPGALASPTLAAGSRDGKTVALYYAELHLVLVVGGVPSNARVIRNVDLVSLSARLSRMAVTNDGAFILYVISEEDRDAIYGWTADRGSHFLTDAQSVGALAISPNGDAIVADSSANEVFTIVDPRNAAVRQPLADASSGISGPSGLVVTEGQRIYVSNSSTDTVLSFDPQGVLLGSQPCSCELAGVFPLKPSVYRLSARADETVYLLDAAPSGDRVVFVPMFRASE